MESVQTATVVEQGKAPARAIQAPISLYLAVAAVTGVLIWTYWLVLPALVRQWWNEDEYSHGFLVPLISLGLVWYHRERLRAIPIRRAYTGLLVMALSLAAYAAGIIGADLFLQRTDFPYLNTEAGEDEISPSEDMRRFRRALRPLHGVCPLAFARISRRLTPRTTNPALPMPPWITITRPITSRTST